MEYSAGVIPYRDGKYYLIKNKESQEWGFPKGHLEPGETTSEAAVRELFEEAGLQAVFVEGFKERVSYFIHDKGSWKTVTYFLGRVVVEERPTTPEEVDGQGWYSYEESMRLLAHEEMRVMLTKASATMRTLS